MYMNYKAALPVIVAAGILLFQSASFGDEAGSPKVMVNGAIVNSDVRIIDNRVYLPIRAISEALGADVSWDARGQTAQVNFKSDETVPNVIKSVCPGVVGIIGNYKDSSDYSNEEKYDEGLVHATGIIISQDGKILTNAHVVNDMDKMAVVLSDGTGYEATLLCKDTESDLALIQIPKTGLHPVQFGTEDDIEIVRTVIAIGTPISFSLRNSASIGIISGVDRSIDSAYKLIQTDAAINPGNSGGPLVGMNGKVIGINSSKFSGAGVEGLGFSIPIGTINYVLAQFQKNGKVIRPGLGVDFEEDWAASYGLSDTGLRITALQSNAVPGIQVDDMLLAVNDQKIRSIVEYNELMKNYAPGDTVYLKISRNGVIQNITATLGKEN